MNSPVVLKGVNKNNIIEINVTINRRIETFMQFIDTHCHLEKEEFSDDLNKVVERAMRKEIAIISFAISPE